MQSPSPGTAHGQSVNSSLSGFPIREASKESTCNAGDMGDVGSVPRSGRSTGGGKLQPSVVFLPEKSRGQRSQMGYSPRDCKESDMTERLNIHIH